MEKKVIQSKLNYLPEILKLQNFFSNHEIKVPLKNQDYGLAIKDPNAGQIVGSHYVLSHYAAGLTILSITTNDDDLMRSSELYLKYIESTNLKYTRTIEYHYDFNNFAWALLLLIDKENPGFLPEQFNFRLSNLLMSTPDSQHDTINWLSMRALNNLVRFQIGGGKPFLKKALSLLSKVTKAQNQDGMFDDLLPIGSSGSIQYHVYTTAILQLIRHFGLQTNFINIDDALNFTINTIDPEGDFNYFGRGTNQLFGWGPFLFNLVGTNISKSVLKKCNMFLNSNLNSCLENNGLLLQNSCADQSNFWWDYHYSTVYSAHLFFWLNLLHIIVPQKSSITKFYKSVNLDVISSERGFCAVFKGKSNYLCERGPQICNIWTKIHGSLFKGPFGPFFDKFGNQHIAKLLVVMNYFGPVVENSANNYFNFSTPIISKLIHKFLNFTKIKTDFAVVVKPLFPTVLRLNLLNDKIIAIEYRLSKSNDSISINIPLFPMSCLNSIKDLISVEFDGKIVDLFHVCSAYGPYGRFELFRSLPKSDVRIIRISISLIKKDN